MSIRFDFGERKHVQLLIHSVKNDNFVILDASYTLIKKRTGVTESQGPCEINDHIIDTIISPQEKGTYELKITYHIADETLIESIEVLVA